MVAPPAVSRASVYWTFADRELVGGKRIRGPEVQRVSLLSLAVSCGTFVLLSLLLPRVPPVSLPSDGQNQSESRRKGTCRVPPGVSMATVAMAATVGAVPAMLWGRLRPGRSCFADFFGEFTNLRQVSSLLWSSLFRDDSADCGHCQTDAV